MLWDFIDSSNGYYKSKITDKQYRSRINVVVRVLGGNEELEATFIREAQKAGITQTKAHPFCPGLRFSMYNAMPIAGVAYLTQFMRKFMIKYPDTKNKSPKM
jgi:phosphoserine aminotransferase